jgi:hypothetical protein
LTCSPLGVSGVVAANTMLGTLTTTAASAISAALAITQVRRIRDSTRRADGRPP